MAYQRDLRQLRRSTFTCARCARTLVLPRMAHTMREAGHVKDLWCTGCQAVTPHHETRAVDHEPAGARARYRVVGTGRYRVVESYPQTPTRPSQVLARDLSLAAAGQLVKEAPKGCKRVREELVRYEREERP